MAAARSAFVEHLGVRLYAQAMAEHDRSHGLDEIADVLADARVVRQALLQPEPAEDSAANHDLSATPQASVAAVKRLITSADLWTLIGADQLFGISLLVRNGETVFPLFPILRSIVEHGASVAWVLDAGVDARHAPASQRFAAKKSSQRRPPAWAARGARPTRTPRRD